MARCGAPLATVVVLAVLLVAAPYTAHAITCGQVVSYLTPCISYARSGGQVPAGCCSGVKGLVAAARTTADRRTACTCLKNTAAGLSGLKPGLISGIPGKCGVRVPYAISPSTDCSRVS
ncbi:non-specific lipid-transfer protein 1 [Elaeis guineensis]|uniref:Non-specific lipid-transfer protein n=1 Tax=Elaeis guineensis var. tenera TaxID=51953 RepID=A0A1D5AIU6_ELAGV|nr:non-specific lipid-transfer protein 1 [Elaeis guineensis]AOC88971.1 type 1 nonspecific lipid transfer protein LTP105 [Elaeis guineensis]